jgi:hypothetical protein
MTQVIASDFEVEQVAEDKNWILFAGERTDVFHFVEYNTKGNNISDPGAVLTHVMQHHIPHLAVARAIETAEAARS